MRTEIGYWRVEYVESDSHFQFAVLSRNMTERSGNKSNRRGRRIWHVLVYFKKAATKICRYGYGVNVMKS